MTAPPLTIGMPVYNGDRHLAEALDAILAQTYGEFELLISDNASTDGTADIIADYAGRDARIRWWRHRANLGAAANYNAVVEEARGRFFKWASHDDSHAPTFLERCVTELEEAGERAVLAYPRTSLIDADGRVLGRFDDRLDLRSPSAARRLRQYALRWRLANVLFGVIRADVLRRTHLVQPYVSSDLTLIAELALRGELHEVPEELFYRRVHPASSRRGTLSLAEVASWFDPGARRPPVVPPLARVWGSTIRVVVTAPDVPVGERLLCAGVYAESWAEKRARARVGRMRRRRTRPSPERPVDQAAPPVS